MMMAGRGDEMPVSAMPIDGTFPPGTTAYEKRNIADEVPRWEADLCIQCGQCSIVCPHSVIRAKYYPEEALDDAPAGFTSAPINARGYPGCRYTLQIYVEDCTGLRRLRRELPGASARPSPDTKAIDMVDKATLIEQEKREHRLLRDAAAAPTARASTSPMCAACSSSQPLFEFSGACAGCGETPYRQAAHRSSSATGCRSPTPPAARRSTAATCRPHPWTIGRRRARAGVVQLAVRGQCRVRPRLPAGDRQADGDGAAALAPSSRRKSARISPRRSSRHRR